MIGRLQINCKLEKSSDKSASVILVGAQPPPIHGMAHVNTCMAKLLAARSCDLTIADVAARDTRTTLAYHFKRLQRNLVALFWILKQPQRSKRTVYLSVDSGWGVFYSLALTLGARLTRSQIVLHHHSARYSQKRQSLFALLARVAGPHATHVLASRNMIEGFRSLYPSARRILQVHNAAFVTSGRQRMDRARPLTLGLLSNLSKDKGVDGVLQTFIGLADAGISCRLILAGPFVDDSSAEAVDNLRPIYGDRIETRGIVSGAAKERFFQEIDVFLFPSTWKHETQSLVVPEAMSFGVPVIAYAHAHVGELLSDSCFAIPPGERFATAAIPILKRWARSPKELLEASARSYEHFEAMRRASTEQLEILIERILNPIDVPN